jgi:glycosyltransferase involved in cell wall biosynthesis
MAAPDVLATYNWGAIEWAMANQLLAGKRHYHFEDGFGPDEIDRPQRRRGMLRRLALARADAVVVPSHTLERIAVSRWHLPASRVIYLPNGVELGGVRGAAVDAPLFLRRDDEIIVGTVAPLRPEKNLGRLLAAFARLDGQPARLVIAGDGSERAALEAFADALGIADRVLFLGAVTEPQRALALFDIFTLSSDAEQMPMAVLEAMAAGLPIAAVDVGDIKHMVAPANRAFIVPRSDATLANALVGLVTDAGRRHALGRLNRAHVGAKYPFARMLEGYARLFEGRP